MGKTGHCLTYAGPAGTNPQGMDQVMLHACNESLRSKFGSQAHPDAQWWHGANQQPSQGSTPGDCCSGFRVWNTDQCLAVGRGAEPRTVVCDVSSRMDQVFRFTDGSDGLAEG